MNDKIIDFHCHIYPGKISRKAVAAIGDFYNVPISYDGTIDTLLKNMEKNNIEHSVVHSTATKAEQVESINDFIIESVLENQNKLVGFATMHPDYQNKEDEFKRIKKLGLKGIKIHPDFQKLYIDQQEMYEIYQLAEAYEMIMLIHLGDYRYEYSSPVRMVKILEKFKSLKVVGAHFGGWSEWENALKYLAGSNLYFDTCSSLAFGENELILQIIKKHTADKILFATDYPMWNVEEELQRFYGLSLSNEQNRKILFDNAKKLLQI